MGSKKALKYIIYDVIQNYQFEHEVVGVGLKDIYAGVAKVMGKLQTPVLEAQIRGRLQENCQASPQFLGKDDLFLYVKPGIWSIQKKVNTEFVQYDRKFYFLYVNHQHVYTDDGWRSFYLSSSLHEGYVLEENQDRIFQVRLKLELGEKKGFLIIEELNEIRRLLEKEGYPSSVGDGYGLAFEVFAIAVLRHYNYEEVIRNYIVHGSFDGKVDAVVWEGKNLFVYQIKVGPADIASLSIMGQNLLHYGRKEKMDENARDLKKFLDLHCLEVENMDISYITVSTTDSKSSTYENIQPKKIYQDYFEQLFLPISENGISLIIPLPSSTEENRGYSITPYHDYVFFIRADIFIQALFSSNKSRWNDLSLYCCDNVRGVLSDNLEMIHTIEEEPENFCKYNNGISITGIVKQHELSLEILNPVINNGQQTLYNLISVSKNLDRIYLMLSIKNSIQNEIKSRISRYTNDQVKVKLIDILSLNPYVRDLQKKIFWSNFMTVDESQSYFLDIYSQGKQVYQQKLNTLCARNRVIHLLDFIRLYFSLQDPSRLGYWKSTPSSQLKGIYDQIDRDFDFDKSQQICQVIIIVEDYIDQVHDKKLKADLSCADLAIEYLMCYYHLQIEVAVQVVSQFNQDYYYKEELENKVSKLIDLYKSPLISGRLEQYVKKMEVFDGAKR